MRVRKTRGALVKSHTLSVKTLKIFQPKKKKSKTEQIVSFSGCSFAIIPPTENILLYAVYINHFVPDCPLQMTVCGTRVRFYAFVYERVHLQFTSVLRECLLKLLPYTLKGSLLNFSSLFLTAFVPEQKNTHTHTISRTVFQVEIYFRVVLSTPTV